MEQKTTKDFTVKTLHKVVDWLIHDCRECICQLCVYLPTSEWDGGGDVPEGVEPCKHRRKHGDVVCRNGIIEHFQMDLIKEVDHGEICKDVEAYV